MSLNKDQRNALEKVTDFIYSPFDYEKPFFTITGGPGTGKTYMLKEVIDQFPSRYKIAAATIGHSAKNVLVNGLGEKPDYYTIVKLLGMQMKEDGTDDFIVPLNRKNNIAGYDVVILDEISTIPDELFELIINDVRHYKIKLIAVGDNHQLPPVGQDHDSKFFDTIDATLTESMRFKGPIQELVKAIEIEIDNIAEDEAFNTNVIADITGRKDNYDLRMSTGYMFLDDINKMLLAASSQFNTQSHELNKARLLAFKNETVRDLNHKVRQIMTNSEAPPPFLPGELLISNKNYKYRRSTPVIYNGQIEQVESFERVIDSYGIPCINLHFYNFKMNKFVEIKVLDRDHSETIPKYNEILQELKHRAMNDHAQWHNFYRFKGEYADFDYAYAINAYKA
jgi:ATP-dependent exoDNAse (exonuclease V) alpha subunit